MKLIREIIKNFQTNAFDGQFLNEIRQFFIGDLEKFKHIRIGIYPKPPSLLNFLFIFYEFCLMKMRHFPNLPISITEQNVFWLQIKMNNILGTP